VALNSNRTVNVAVVRMSTNAVIRTTNATGRTTNAVACAMSVPVCVTNVSAVRTKSATIGGVKNTTTGCTTNAVPGVVSRTSPGAANVVCTRTTAKAARTKTTDGAVAAIASGEDCSSMASSAAVCHARYPHRHPGGRIDSNDSVRRPR